MNPVRVLVVDDSPLIRQILVDMLRREPDIEVVGYARDGEEALLRIAETSPDVVTLDVEMPRLDGLGCLRELMKTRPVPTVMVSTLTAAGTATTLEALAIGAVDFVCKPNNGSLSTLRGVREELVEKVRGARGARVHRAFRPVPKAASVPTAAKSDRVVLVASSTGGPRALAAMMEGIPKGFAAPMLIVQHMPVGFTAPLAKRLGEIGPMAVREARPGDRLEPGVALVAPGGRHMTVRADGALAFDDGPTVHGVRPAADRLFASAAEAFGRRCVAAVLSGMGRDGADGALAIRERGGTVLAEAEETCTIYGMPKAAVASGAVERSVPIDRMGGAIAEAAAGKILNAR